jgi:hypothetical protein
VPAIDTSCGAPPFRVSSMRHVSPAGIVNGPASVPVIAAAVPWWNAADEVSSSASGPVTVRGRLPAKPTDVVALGGNTLRVSIENAWPVASSTRKPERWSIMLPSPSSPNAPTRL